MNKDARRGMFLSKSGRQQAGTGGAPCHRRACHRRVRRDHREFSSPESAENALSKTDFPRFWVAKTLSCQLATPQPVVALGSTTMVKNQEYWNHLVNTDPARVISYLNALTNFSPAAYSRLHPGRKWTDRYGHDMAVGAIPRCLNHGLVFSIILTSCTSDTDRTYLMLHPLSQRPSCQAPTLSTSTSLPELDGSPSSARGSQRPYYATSSQARLRHPTRIAWRIMSSLR